MVAKAGEMQKFLSAFRRGRPAADDSHDSHLPLLGYAGGCPFKSESIDDSHCTMTAQHMEVEGSQFCLAQLHVHDCSSPSDMGSVKNGGKVKTKEIRYRIRLFVFIVFLAAFNYSTAWHPV